MVYLEGYYTGSARLDSGAKIGYADYQSLGLYSFLWQAGLTELVQPIQGHRVVLDVGCAVGNYLRLARHFGWEALGIDVSSEAVSVARDKGLKVVDGDIQSAGLPDYSFDLITIWDVLEHIEDLRPFLQACRKCLKGQGSILFSTPLPSIGGGEASQASISFRQSYEHLSYFTPQSIRLVFTSVLGGHVYLARVRRGPYWHLLGLWTPTANITDSLRAVLDVRNTDAMAIFRHSFDETDMMLPPEPESAAGEVLASLQMGDAAGAIEAWGRLTSDGYRGALWDCISDSFATTQLDLSSAPPEEVRTHYGALIQAMMSLTGVVSEELIRSSPVVATDTDQTISLSQAYQDLQVDLEDAQRRAEALSAELNRIYHSRSWGWLTKAWSLRRRFRRRREHRGRNLLTPTESLASRSPRVSHDVIVFGVTDWKFRTQRPQHLARQLVSRGHRVFFISVDFVASPTMKVEDVEDGVFIVYFGCKSPPNVYLDELSDDQCQLFVAQLHSLRLQYFIPYASLMVEHPFWAPIALSLRERLEWAVIYDCMDDHSGFAVRSETIEARDVALLREADAVIVTSRLLADRAEALNRKVVMLPNGSDVAHFESARSGERSGTQPTIGYFGAIAEWFDADLVRDLAVLHPTWRFTLIGAVTHPYAASVLGALPNITLVGEVSYDDLPLWTKSFDVCIIPFIVSRLTRATNPVKVFEYLSAGKPVVATKLPELEPLGHVVDLATDFGEWEEALSRRLAAPSDGLSARIAAAEENDWRIRGEVLHELLGTTAPRVSIIVVSFGNWILTKRCLESIVLRTVYPNYEVLVVDNGSDSATKSALVAWIKGRERFSLVQNETNQGFAAANNQGITMSTGQYLVLLNNDTVVTQGWLAALVSAAKRPEVGLVCPVTNRAGNEAQINVDYSRGLDTFARLYTQSKADEDFDLECVPLFCAAFRREVIERVGLLDEGYGRGMFEDDDLSFRVRRMGYRTIGIEYAFVHHEGSASFSILPDDAYQRLMADNRRRFEKKWGTTWKPHKYRTGVR